MLSPQFRNDAVIVITTTTTTSITAAAARRWRQPPERIDGFQPPGPVYGKERIGPTGPTGYELRDKRRRVVLVLRERMLLGSVPLQSATFGVALEK